MSLKMENKSVHYLDIKQQNVLVKYEKKIILDNKLAKS